MLRFFIALALITFLFGARVRAEAVPDAQRRLAASTTVTTQQARILSQSPYWQVRQALASNRRTPVAVLDRLARDRNSDVRIAVATNLSTIDSTFIQLAHDKSPDVRSVVARFEYVPLAALRILASDQRADIRLEVAKNLNADRGLLQRLARDSDSDVASVALAGLQRLRDEGHQDSALP